MKKIIIIALLAIFTASCATVRENPADKKFAPPLTMRQKNKPDGYIQKTKIKIVYKIFKY